MSNTQFTEMGSTRVDERWLSAKLVLCLMIGVSCPRLFPRTQKSVKLKVRSTKSIVVNPFVITYIYDLLKLQGSDP